ncbi:MAG: helicase-exonuclease AddAB subunit AddA [Eubacteriales bacterium]|nr:helicase-exonuclease AddAB subunit AddA [Eubacteriales bacterium]
MSKSAVNWTKEQRQVIESRGKDLLVSAAAGSGKTAVLVERIIRMVTEGEHPLDIDRLLVMTFTKAAAAEMRERIGAAIEERLLADPGNAHLQIQSALVHHAQITTIDSFCLNVIREHFNLLDLDPAFRIGDEGELLLLKGDVMAELIEDFYKSGGGRFERFAETFGQGKGDGGIEDYIFRVHDFSQSNPYPEQWIAQCRRELAETFGQLEGITGRLPAWMEFLMEDVRRQAGELAVQMEEAKAVCEEDDALQVYAPAFTEDIRKLKALGNAGNFRELHGLLAGFSWGRLAAVRSKDADVEKKAWAAGCRDRAKKAVGKMQELYCFASPDEAFADMENSREPVEVLLDLAEEFDRRYREKKRDRNLVDFNDLEHEALKVLTRFEDGKTVYTEAADALSSQFEEVLVDEYQDSNLIQEALLQAVSRSRFGQHNVFMVGDVKQSIYKFRLARPELFLEKYEAYEPYESGEGAQKKIELHQNFRSRTEVLEGINDVFFQIMTENLGNIRYTEDAALHPGAQFAPAPGEAEREEPSFGETGCDAPYFGPRRAGIPELLVVDTGAEAMAGLDEEAADFTAREIEGKLIAGRIREMTDPRHGMLVWDKRLGAYRTARYRDIVILLRSTAGWTENLLSVLMNEGIPAYAESRTGYFNTTEVETVLSVLSVIDNPMQDIPLAAVLKSPVCGLTDEDLAWLAAWYKGLADKGQDRGIYGAVRAWLARQSADQDGEERDPGISEETSERLSRFWKLLEGFRQRSIYLPIHELIYQVYEETGYYHLVSAMPAGQTRRANLDMLVEKAVEYERISYKGLFHFVRYIENLKRYQSDFGEASTAGEEDDTVRIMSIHKSKGLEFPIVFLAGMGKKFNRQDAYSRLLIDPELGIATDYFDLEHRLKATTLKKNALRRKVETDNLGEELRVLYVAMTRAKEQLIMTGTDRHLAAARTKYSNMPVAAGQLHYTVLSGAGSYLDWLFMCFGGNPVRIRLTEVLLEEIMSGEVARQAVSAASKEFLLELDPDRIWAEDYGRQLRENLDYVYPYEADIRLHTKMSVSELKKQGQLTDEAEAVQFAPVTEPDSASRKADAASWQQEPASRQPDLVSPRPDPAARQSDGAARGTAFHRIMELLAFDRIDSRETLEEAVAGLVDAGKFTRENFELLDLDAVWRFFCSGLGKRMARAQAEGRLHKEQQFVMGIPARELGAGDSEELVVIQGIIDAYFEEEDGLVLMDYKTDRVRRPETLIEHYKVQLDYYERALRQMTGKNVREKLIYSVTLNEVISCA